MSVPNNDIKIFQPLNLRFNILDLFKVPRLATKAKKLGIAFVGVIAIYFTLFLSNFLIILLNGINITDYWNHHRFVLFQYSLPDSLNSIFILCGGITLSLVILMLTSGGISKIAFEEFKGNKLVTIGAGFTFLKENKFSLLFPPVGILIIIGFFLLLWVVFGLISSLPWIGPNFFGFLYLFYFFTALFLVFTCIVCVFSIAYGPMIFTSWGGDAFTVIFQTYSIFWSQPFRLFVYTIVNVVITCLFTCFIGGVYWGMIQFINTFFSQSFLLGETFQQIWHSALHILNPLNFTDYSNSMLEFIPALLVAVSLGMIFLHLISIFLSNIVTGRTMVFIILRKIDSGFNLLTLKNNDK